MCLEQQRRLWCPVVVSTALTDLSDVPGDMEEGRGCGCSDFRIMQYIRSRNKRNSFAPSLSCYDENRSCLNLISWTIATVAKDKIARKRKIINATSWNSGVEFPHTFKESFLSNGLPVSKCWRPVWSRRWICLGKRHAESVFFLSTPKPKEPWHFFVRFNKVIVRQ